MKYYIILLAVFLLACKDEPPSAPSVPTIGVTRGYSYTVGDTSVMDVYFQIYNTSSVTVEQINVKVFYDRSVIDSAYYNTIPSFESESIYLKDRPVINSIVATFDRYTAQANWKH